MPASAILLLESDATAGQQIHEILSGVGHTVDQVASTTDLLTSAGGHKLIIVDIRGGEETAADVARELRASPVVAAIPILCFSDSDDVEARIKLLESGADDVVARPFDRRELEARVEALLLRFERTQDRGATIGPDGTLGSDRRRTIAVFSPKGGTGTTTIAVNLAIIAAERASDAVVIDLDLQFGQVATHLNIEANQSLVDVVRDEAALREPEVLRTYATRHDAGVHVLAAPPSPQYAELVSPANVEEILSVARGSWDTVVIDAGSNLDERTLAVFEAAEVVILPVYPEIACLKAVHALMDYLAETGSVGGKSQFVVNNLFAREVLKLRDIESSLGAKVATELPYDPFVYLKAVNEGVPVVIGAPKSAAAERLGRLAKIAFGGDDPAPQASEERRGGRLSGLLRRT